MEGDSCFGGGWGRVKWDVERGGIGAGGTVEFFFSSRRRHTRCSRDWGSDVYSSDLMWTLAALVRSLSLLAILLLFLTMWGFTGIAKLVNGFPAWFPEKFGNTLLGKFPGLQATFWKIGRASCRERSVVLGCDRIVDVK